MTHGWTANAEPKRPSDVRACGEGGTPLVLATAANRIDVIEALLADGADPSAPSFGFTPVHMAAQINSVEAIRLLSYSVSIELQDSEMGSRPLHVAASYGSAEATKELLSMGADVTSEAYCGTAISLTDSKAVMACLLAHGSPVGPTTITGQVSTPLHAARFEELTQMLCDCGSDIHARDEHGDTAIDIALLCEVEDVLLAEGATRNPQK